MFGKTSPLIDLLHVSQISDIIHLPEEQEFIGNKFKYVF